MPLAYHLLDVFTSTPFTGNPLAVIVDAEPSPTRAQAQTVARELNLSETVVLERAPGPAAWTAHIFTPTRQLPFAGHPTIGAACLVALLDPTLLGEASSASVVLHEQLGAFAVDVTTQGAQVASGRCTLPAPPAQLPAPSPDAVAAALGLAPNDLHPDLAVAAWSMGLGFTIVPVRDVAALGVVRVDTAAWASVLAATDAPSLYVVTPLEDGAWRARMFAPDLGFAEDPATGSAASAFAGYVAALDPGRDAWTIHQGVEMGRPSAIAVDVERRDGAVQRVHFAGSAVVVGGGWLEYPST